MQQELAAQAKAEEAARAAAEEAELAALDEALGQSLEEELAYEKSVTDAQAVASAQLYIFEEVRSKWVRPPNARNGMVVDLLIRLVPTGEVVGMEVTYRLDATDAYVASVQKAVRKVGKFDKLSALDAVVFDANFREFTLRFRSEDLRL